MRKRHTCVHIQFSNSSNLISLFERKGVGEREPAPVKSKVTNVLTWSRKRIVFTLIGDVHSSELRKIAASMR